jgi:hypothetical protein
MTKFVALRFKQLPNAAHFNFCTQVKSTLALAGEPVTIALGTLPAEFNTWYNKEQALMEWVRKSELTQLIADADKQMDHILVGFTAKVKADEYNPLAKTAEAARRLSIMLNNYKHPYRRPYEQQAGDMRAILLQLNGDYSVDVQTLGLLSWVTELQAALDAFQQLLTQRDSISLLKPADTFPEVRRGIESTYHQIVTLIDSGAALGVSPDFALFINKLNPEIDRLNLEFNRTRRTIADAEPEPIPQQHYTGQPVTPTPDIFYVTPHDGTVKLELGKDYNLTYKNNTKVGNAQCTLHGKGKYTGRKTVTFIIAR